MTICTGPGRSIARRAPGRRRIEDREQAHVYAAGRELDRECVRDEPAEREAREHEPTGMVECEQGIGEPRRDLLDRTIGGDARAKPARGQRPHATLPESTHEGPEAQRVLTAAGEQHDWDVAGIAASEDEHTDAVGPQGGLLDAGGGRIGVLDHPRQRRNRAVGHQRRLQRRTPRVGDRESIDDRLDELQRAERVAAELEEGLVPADVTSVEHGFEQGGERAFVGRLGRGRVGTGRDRSRGRGAQGHAVDLAVRQPRDLAHGSEHVREHEARKSRRETGPEVAHGQECAPVGDDPRDELRVVAPRDRRHLGVADAVDRTHRGRNRREVDGEAVHLDARVVAAPDEQAAVGQQLPEVTDPEPPFAVGVDNHRLFLEVGCIEVPAARVRRPDPQLARLAHGDVDAVGDHPDAGVVVDGEGQEQRIVEVVAREEVDVGDAGDLGGSVVAADARVREPLPGAGHVLDREWGTGAHHERETGHRPLSGLGRVEEGPQQPRSEMEPVDVVLLDEVEDRAAGVDAVSTRTGTRAAAQRLHRAHPDRRRPHRREQQHRRPQVAVEAVAVDVAIPRLGHHPLGRRHELRHSRGARGADDPRVRAGSIGSSGATALGSTSSAPIGTRPAARMPSCRSTDSASTNPAPARVQC